MSGAAVIAPDYVRETFKPSTEHGRHDGTVENKDRSIRWLMQTFDANPEDATHAVHLAFLLRENDVVSVEYDRHTEGLFTPQNPAAAI